MQMITKSARFMNILRNYRRHNKSKAVYIGDTHFSHTLGHFGPGEFGNSTRTILVYGLRSTDRMDFVIILFLSRSESLISTLFFVYVHISECAICVSSACESSQETKLRILYTSTRREKFVAFVKTGKKTKWNWWQKMFGLGTNDIIHSIVSVRGLILLDSTNQTHPIRQTTVLDCHSIYVSCRFDST